MLRKYEYVHFVKMAGLLDTFEQQYAKLTADITSKTGKLVQAKGEEKLALIDEILKHTEDAKELLEQMELVVQDIPAVERVRHRNRIKSYRVELTRLTQDVKRANLIPQNDENQVRSDLLGQDDFDDKQALLLDNTEKLERSSRKLDMGYRLAVESEQIGAEILNNLHSQRETITNARKRLHDTNDDLGKSSRILSSMFRRVIQNRLQLYVVSIIVFIVIVIAIYLSVT